MTDTRKLLSEYVQHGSETAFRELVTRYVDFVYSAALRLVSGNTQLAEDISQTVFLDLSRQAGSVSGDVMLGGWLHRHTCFVAANVLRGERRRQTRERQAVEMNALDRPSGIDFSHVGPLLDEAINELSEDDRRAILLRYFEQREFAAIAGFIGSTEDAARMRVNRALEKLESLLQRRGITSTGAAFGIALSEQAIHAAPAGLAATICSAITFSGTAVLTATIATKTTMSLLTVKTACAIVAAAIAAGTATYFIQERQMEVLRNENSDLKSRQTALTAERDKAATASTANADELARLKKNQEDLLRLRSEITQLRRQAESQKAQVAVQPTLKAPAKQPDLHAPGTYIPADQLGNVGYATPETSLETTTWAMLRGTYDDVKKSLNQKFQQEEDNNPHARADFESSQARMGSMVKGFQIVARKTLPNGTVELKVKEDYDQVAASAAGIPPTPEFMIQPMAQEGNDWRISGSTRGYQAGWDDAQVQWYAQ